MRGLPNEGSRALNRVVGSICEFVIIERRETAKLQIKFELQPRSDVRGDSPQHGYDSIPNRKGVERPIGLDAAREFTVSFPTDCWAGRIRCTGTSPRATAHSSA